MTIYELLNDVFLFQKNQNELNWNREEIVILEDKRTKTMNYTNRVSIDPDIMLGKPVIKGARITVELILRKLSNGLTIDQILIAYQHLSKEDVYAALTYASDLIANEEIIIPQPS
ncbi:MAG: hypothetical protein ACJA2S_004621 [Cyclobacteriaceae bacterium]|jgi:uncharacterized protein (DUF433 family)